MLHLLLDTANTSTILPTAFVASLILLVYYWMRPSVLECVTPVESYMDRLELLFLCSICSARCLRTPYFCLHTYLYVLPTYIWPPYTRISRRYACVLDTCVNVSLRECTKNVCTGRQLCGLSMPVVRCEPASQQLLLLAVSARGC